PVGGRRRTGAERAQRARSREPPELAPGEELAAERPRIWDPPQDERRQTALLGEQDHDPLLVERVERHVAGHAAGARRLPAVDRGPEVVRRRLELGGECRGIARNRRPGRRRRSSVHALQASGAMIPGSGRSLLCKRRRERWARSWSPSSCRWTA